MRAHIRGSEGDLSFRSGLNDKEFWADFKFPPVNLYSLPYQHVYMEMLAENNFSSVSSRRDKGKIANELKLKIERMRKILESA